MDKSKLATGHNLDGNPVPDDPEFWLAPRKMSPESQKHALGIFGREGFEKMYGYPPEVNIDS
jgi:hypothetical protein